jgi:hypothetical protein
MSVTPTRPDNPAKLEPTPGAPNRRRGVSFKIVALIAVGLFAVAGVIAYVAYERLLHYERVAALHIPQNAAWAARLDVERVALFEPVRKHLFPLVQGAASAEAGSPQPAESAQLMEALRRKAGLNLGLDLREIVVAGLPDWGGWVLVLGGLFPDRTDLLVRISEVLFEQVGLPIRFEADSVLLLPGGHAFAQAGDGSLLLASSPELVRAARASSQRYVELGLGKEEGVGGFALQVRELGSLTGGLLGLTSLGSVERVRGSLQSEANGRLGVRVELSTLGAAPALAQNIQSSIQSMQMMFGLVSAADWAEARALVTRAEVRATPENTVLLSSFWESAELDRACAALSRWLGGQMRAN